MTAQARGRLKKLMDQYKPHHIPGEFDELLDPETGIHPYLLVEKNTYDGSYWLSLHESPHDAGAYRDGQEYPEDWNVTKLLDLETEQELEPRTTFEPKTSSGPSA